MAVGLPVVERRVAGRLVVAHLLQARKALPVAVAADLAAAKALRAAGVVLEAAEAVGEWTWVVSSSSSPLFNWRT